MKPDVKVFVKKKPPVETVFPDTERNLLVALVSQALVQARPNALAELNSVLSKLSGTDTVLVARRVYAPHKN